MTVYPNPATDLAHVKFTLNDAASVSFSVSDLMGRVLISNPAEQMAIGGHQINFSTASLPTGLYNVVVTTATGNITQRLTVTK
jgi:hypothetical protein